MSGFFFFFACEHSVVPAPFVKEIILLLFGSLALLFKISRKDDPICETAEETQMYRTVFWTLWEKARVG